MYVRSRQNACSGRLHCAQKTKPTAYIQQSRMRTKIWSESGAQLRLLHTSRAMIDAWIYAFGHECTLYMPPEAIKHNKKESAAARRGCNLD